MRWWTKLALLTLPSLAFQPMHGQAAAAETNPRPASWMSDGRTGCKVWDPEPEAQEGVRWSGRCLNGLASGRGVTEWTVNGVVIERTEGARIAGHLQGKGVQTLGNGDRFEGAWKDDRKEGYGTYRAAEGWTYAGQFRNDRFDGVGVMTDAKGNRYEGGWKAGRRNGQGTYVGSDGSRFSGLWVDDQPIGGRGSAV